MCYPFSQINLIMKDKSIGVRLNFVLTRLVILQRPEVCSSILFFHYLYHLFVDYLNGEVMKVYYIIYNSHVDCLVS